MSEIRVPSLRPVELAMTPDQRLAICWSDGAKRLYRPRELRDKCPCATCREKRSDTTPAPMFQVLSPAEVAPIRILGMKPVGQYAYAIQFSDDHDTGIFTFDLLIELGEPA